jgi:hypothetical protein
MFSIIFYVHSIYYENTCRVFLQLILIYNEPCGSANRQFSFPVTFLEDLIFFIHSSLLATVSFYIMFLSDVLIPVILTFFASISITPLLVLV